MLLYRKLQLKIPILTLLFRFGKVRVWTSSLLLVSFGYGVNFVVVLRKLKQHWYPTFSLNLSSFARFCSTNSFIREVEFQCRSLVSLASSGRCGQLKLFLHCPAVQYNPLLCQSHTICSLDTQLLMQRVPKATWMCVKNCQHTSSCELYCVMVIHVLHRCYIII